MAVRYPISENRSGPLFPLGASCAQVLVEFGDEQVVLAQDGGHSNSVAMPVRNNRCVNACGIRALLGVLDLPAHWIDLRVGVERGIQRRTRVGKLVRGIPLVQVPHLPLWLADSGRRSDDFD